MWGGVFDWNIMEFGITELWYLELLSCGIWSQ